MKLHLIRSIGHHLRRRMLGRSDCPPQATVAALAGLLPVVASAATISWSGPQNIVGDADVFRGRVVTGAFEVGGPPTGFGLPGNTGGTVNGTRFVPFGLDTSSNSATMGNFTFTSPTSFASNNFVGFPGPPYTTLSPGYQSILSSLGGTTAPGGIPPAAAVTLTMRRLTVGRIYTFQWWENDSFVGSAETITATAGKSLTLNSNTSNLNGGLGQFGTGTFIADSSTQMISFAGTGFDSVLNAFQLVEGGHATYHGNFSQTPSSVLSLVLTSPTNFDSLTVRGAAFLGGTLDLSLSNGFAPKPGEKFTVIESEGLSGHYRKVNAPIFDFLTLRPIYGKDDLVVQVQVDSFAALPGMTANTQAVGKSLDAAINDPRATNLLSYLYERSLSELPKDLAKISPESLTSIFSMAVALEQQQSINLQRRTDDIRNGSGGFSAAGLAVNGAGPSYSGSFGLGTGVAGPSGNDGKESKEDMAVADFDFKDWGVFLSGTGEWVSVGNTDNARGYNLDSGGFTLGVDYKVTPNFAIGVAAGYTGTSADLVDRGRVYVNGGKIGLYATFFQNQQAATAPMMSKDSSKDSSKEAPTPAPSIAKGFYADLAVFGGYNSYDTRRSALQGEARGDTDGGELNALAGIGYDFKKGGLTFGPTASFNYTYLGTNEFTEHGSLAPLDVHGGKGESLRTAFGIKASYDWKVGGILIKPEIRAAWQHEYGDSAYSLDSSFANGAGNSFLVNGPELGRDSALLGAGFAVQFNDRMSTYFYYDGELGRKNYQSTSVTGGFRVAF